MQLWDQAIRTRTDEIRRLPPTALADLATSAIEGTTGLLALSSDQFCPPPAAQLIASAIRDCRASAPRWRLDGAHLARFTDSLDAVQGLPMRPGCGPLTMAALSLVDGMTGDLSPETTMEVLSSCYEAVFLSQLTGRTTAEQEQHNLKCQTALALQQKLISQFSGNGH